MQGIINKHTATQNIFEEFINQRISECYVTEINRLI